MVTTTSSRERPVGSPLVTIGLPVFNGEKYLARALDSLLSQTFVDFEVIISDNCSSDSTESICRSFARRDARINYRRQSTNIGGHRNFRFVTERAAGQFVTWLAHDDLLEPRFLELAVDQLIRYPQTVIASGDFQVIDAAGRALEVERLETIRSNVPWPARRVEFFKYPISNVFYCIYGLMRTEECKRILSGLPEPKIATGSELPVLSRFAISGEIVSIPVVLRRYRRHAESAFLTEVAGLRRMPRMRRELIAAKNLYRLRFDQIRVLLASDLPLVEKARTLVAVLSFYVGLFFRRVRRLPSKLKELFPQ